MSQRDGNPQQVQPDQDTDPGGRELVLKHVRNERKKLLANAVDRASTTCITVGVATPIAGVIFKVNGFGIALANSELGLAVLGFLGAAVLLHLAARRALRGLEP
jgi:hypothetical protein